MFDGWAVYNRDAGFRPLKCERAQAGTLTAAHDTHLHTEVFVLDRFNYTDTEVLRRISSDE
jgi:hypothetical protein